MTRIAYRQPGEMTDQARELTRARGNLNVYRALANAEKVFTGWMLAGQAALTSPVLPVRLRELVVLRTAYLMDCPYELGQHRDVARTAGVGVGEINAVLSESDWHADHFNGVEFAALQLATEAINRGDDDLIWLATGPGLITRAFAQTLAMSRKQNISMRMAALSLGVKRVQEAKHIRGLFP